jgi:hypothetical protein
MYVCIARCITTLPTQTRSVGSNMNEKEQSPCHRDGPRGRLQMLDDSKAMGKVNFGKVLLVTDTAGADVAYS